MTVQDTYDASVDFASFEPSKGDPNTGLWNRIYHFAWQRNQAA